MNMRIILAREDAKIIVERSRGEDPHNGDNPEELLQLLIVKEVGEKIIDYLMSL